MTAGRAASIHARLLNRAKARGEDFNLILTRYAIERALEIIGEAARRVSPALRAKHPGIP